LKTNDNIVIEQGDCLELMKKIPDKHIDMILCDLPYEKSMGKWDSLINLEKLWEQYIRIIKNHHAIVLFSQNPFSAKLILSNPEWYKYNWVWDKGKAGNIFTAKLCPLITHEDILIFSNGTIANGSKRNMIYYPQMVELDKPIKYSMKTGNEKSFLRESHKSIIYKKTHNYPKSVYYFYNSNVKGKLHPTQKPVGLLEYLIRTYSLEGETVLDNAMGVASTGVACINTHRKFVGYELDEEYFEIGKNRLIEHL
jgi:site-specific DNA-methyltransferase (adenine-specific)